MIGPVQVLVVGFDEPTFSGEVLAELTRLQQAGIVRLIDLLLVSRPDVNTLETVTSDHVPAGFGRLAAALLAEPEDGPTASNEVGPGEAATWSLADAVPVGQTAAVALLEHTWASPLRDAIRHSGGRPLDETWLGALDLERLEQLIAQQPASP